MTRFKIIVTVRNAERWIERCLQSVLTQSYPLWQCIVVDDASTDRTFDNALRVTGRDARFLAMRQEQRQESHLVNQNLAVQASRANSRDVLVILDGDDWLHDDGVLHHLAIVFKSPDVWLSYGSFVLWTADDAPLDTSWKLPAYSTETLRSGTVRQEDWRASHLRAFRAGLWRAVDQDRYCRRDGRVVNVAVDHGMMFPMMELARERCIHVERPMLIYNFANPESFGRQPGGKERADEMAAWLRTLPPCDRMQDL